MKNPLTYSMIDIINMHRKIKEIEEAKKKGVVENYTIFGLQPVVAWMITGIYAITLIMAIYMLWVHWKTMTDPAKIVSIVLMIFFPFIGSLVAMYLAYTSTGQKIF